MRVCRTTTRRPALAVFASAAWLCAAAGVALAQQGYGNYYGQKFQESGGQLGTRHVSATLILERQ